MKYLGVNLDKQSNEKNPQKLSKGKWNDVKT